MDANKRLKLLAIGYEIQPSCGTCYFSEFRTGSDYGDCKWHTYDHAKHTEATRPLSINRYGVCGDHVESESFEQTVSLWREFVAGEA